MVEDRVLLVNKGWDDGSFEILVDLDEGRVTELGENSEDSFSVLARRSSR